MLKSKNGIIMDGRTATTSHPYFAFAPMGRFQLPFSTSLDQYTTVRLLSLETYTTSWRIRICRRGQSAALTRHSTWLTGTIYTNGARIFWDPAPTRRERILDLQEKREATSAWQTAEWGMLALQASFSRLKDQFVNEERGERRIVLKMMVLLYNMWAWMVGINQIRNTYMPHLMRDANEDVSF
jgi:hypothetical protein